MIRNINIIAMNDEIMNANIANKALLSFFLDKYNIIENMHKTKDKGVSVNYLK